MQASFRGGKALNSDLVLSSVQSFPSAEDQGSNSKNEEFLGVPSSLHLCPTKSHAKINRVQFSN